MGHTAQALLGVEMTGSGGADPSEAVFSSTDPDEIEDYLTRSYGPSIRLQRHRTSYRLEHRRTTVGAVSLDTVRSDGYAAQVPPTGQLMVVLVDAGSVDRETDGTRQRYGAGEAFVMARPLAPCAVDWRGDPASIRTLTLDVDLLAAVAGVPSSRAATIAVDQGGAPDPRLVGRFTDLLGVTVDSVRDDHGTGRAPRLVADAAARLLAAATLTTFPNDLVPAEDPTDRPDSRPATLRRAVAHIESHPDQPMSLTDISAAAHVTPRALQLAFRRHLQTTPLGYLRRVRLDRAHEDLVGADPSEQTVTGIAARWGFLDASRFAASYRSIYGRSPHQTLRS